MSNSEILLIRPPIAQLKRLNLVVPLGLGYISAALKKQGFNPKIIDCVENNQTVAELTALIKQTQPKLIGFQTYSQDVFVVNQCIEVIKKVSPKTIIVVGGPHPCAVRGDIFKHIPGVDFAFLGEAEKSFVQFVECLFNKKLDLENLSKISGLVWQEQSKIMINPVSWIENIDELVFPDWSAIDPRRYSGAPQGLIFKNWPIAPVVATRGCPFSCSFCAGHTVSGKKIRKRSIANLLAEINLLYHEYGVREIHIQDDNFTFDHDYVREFCQALIKSNLKISWCCPNGVRLDTLTKGLVELMQASGCYYISVGIESGSPQILKAMNKNLTIDQIKQQVAMIKNANMDVNGFFIIGYPGETLEDIYKTIDLAISLPLSRAAFYNFMPLAGTQAYEQLLKTNQLNKIDWSKMFQGDTPYVPKGFTISQLKTLQRQAYRRFYFRPGIFFNMLSKIRSFKQLFFIIKRALVYS